MRSNKSKATSHRMTTRSRVSAAPYPNESTSVVFVGITKNNRVVAAARQNIIERINRNDIKPTDLNPGQGWIPTVSNIDANLIQKDSHSSVETNKSSNFADDEDGSSNSTTEESDTESGDGDATFAGYVLYENPEFRTDVPEVLEQPETNEQSTEENATIGENVTIGDCKESDESNVTEVFEQPERNEQSNEENSAVGENSIIGDCMESEE